MCTLLSVRIPLLSLYTGKQATASLPKPKKIYVKANITNSDDNKIRQDLDNADELQEKVSIYTAIKIIEMVVVMMMMMMMMIIITIIITIMVVKFAHISKYTE